MCQAEETSIYLEEDTLEGDDKIGCSKPEHASKERLNNHHVPQEAATHSNISEDRDSDDQRWKKRDNTIADQESQCPGELGLDEHSISTGNLLCLFSLSRSRL